MKILKKLDLRQMTREELTNTRGGEGESSRNLSVATATPFTDREHFVYDDNGKLVAHYLTMLESPMREMDTVSKPLHP